MRRATKLLLGLAAVALVYGAFALLADARALRATLASFDPRALVLAAALALAGFCIRALRWRLYLHRMGVIEPAGREALGFAAGFAMGLASGRSGQVVKAYYLRLATGLPYEVSIPATVGERLADTLSVLLLLLLALALAPRLDAWPALAVGAALLALVPLLRSELPVRAVRRLRSLARWHERLASAHRELRAHLSWRELAAPAVLGLVAFLFEALALQALAERGLAVPLDLRLAILAIALANLAAAATFIPGGVGVAEGGLVVVLTLQGVALANATALTLLFRAATLWLGVALGALAAGTLQLAQRKAERRRAAPAR